ncbi:glycosyltransferase [Mangrovimonas futianensis]|uniref:glycosyltransferase n=1 Tax=Mangrovimonas futianensis TaxID=2895523 RepID=UPI001E3370B8|nr:glycosyltransferase [Mangrovimonas futianensis]MCF1420240.1 glycosyltransferase [Mangrovimonas futianensis]
MNRKKNVLIFIDWFLPGYKAGGPIQSVNNMISHLNDEFYFYVVTSNKDLGEKDPYQNILFNSWIDKQSYHIIYLDEAHQNKAVYLRLLKEANFYAIYFNSFFSIKFSLIPQWVYRSVEIKKVLAPRGMLGAGALAIKPLKKQVFLKLFRWLGFHKKVVWHATSELEKDEIIKQLGDNLEIKIAPNLSSKMASFVESTKEVHHLKVFFLSRIAFKKGLIHALNFLQETKKDMKITFSIIGPIDEKDYWDKCQKIINSMPLNVSVDYLGAIPNFQLATVLKEQHVLLLPTMHENFGHVIMESWQNGCPVIISDQTPWRNLKDKQIGSDISLSKSSEFVEMLNTFSLMDEKTFNLWSRSSYNYAKIFTENPKLIESTKNIFF